MIRNLFLALCALAFATPSFAQWDNNGAQPIPLSASSNTNSVRDRTAVWVSAAIGDDNNSGTATSPKRTIVAAKNVATNGSTIFVYPGTYRESNLLKKGVNYFFFTGANILYIASSTNDTRGLFDDRDISGGTTNRIYAPASRFEFITCTNLAQFYNTNVDDGSSASFTVNWPKGAVVITNPATSVNMDIGELGVGGIALGNPLCAMRVDNCRSNSVFRFNRVFHSLRGVSVFAPPGINEIEGGYEYTSDALAFETFDGGGDIHCATIDLMTSYGWHFGSLTATSISDWRLHFGKSYSYFYGAESSPNARWWARGIELDVDSGYGALSFFGIGRGYFEIEKINNTLSGSPAIVTSSGNGTNYIRTLRIQSAGAWVEVDGTNVTTVECQSYGPNGALSGGVFTRATFVGQLYINGGRANSNTNDLKHLGSGYVFLSDFYAKAATAPNIYVGNSNAVVIDSVLVTGGFTNIYSPSAQTIALYNGVTGNKTNTNPATLTIDGTFTSNANAR